MVKAIKVNLEEIESMLYFWQSVNERQRISEEFLEEVASMQGLTDSYDEEFKKESVRKVLSAIANREKLSETTKKEARFWNNNMWMLEDLSYTNSMIQPLKKLNLDSLVEKFQNLSISSNFEKIEIIFSPLHMVDYILKGNKVIINFFRVMPSLTEEASATIDGKPLKSYVHEKIIELMAQ